MVPDQLACSEASRSESTVFLKKDESRFSMTMVKFGYFLQSWSCIDHSDLVFYLSLLH